MNLVRSRDEDIPANNTDGASIPQVRATPVDPLAPCLGLLCRSDPADEFVSRQRRNGFPGGPCSWIEWQRDLQIAWKSMDEAAGDDVSSVIGSTEPPPSGADSAFVFGERVRNEGIGVAMAHAVLLLQPSDVLHVPRRGAGAQERLPLSDGTPVLLLDGREVGGGTFDLVFAHEVQMVLRSLGWSSGSPPASELISAVWVEGSDIPTRLNQRPLPATSFAALNVQDGRAPDGGHPTRDGR
jgi:hypothetical protein